MDRLKDTEAVRDQDADQHPERQQLDYPPAQVVRPEGYDDACANVHQLTTGFYMHSFGAPQILGDQQQSSDGSQCYQQLWPHDFLQQITEHVLIIREARKNPSADAEGFPEKVLPDCLTRLLVGNVLPPIEFGVILYVFGVYTSTSTHNDVTLLYVLRC